MNDFHIYEVVGRSKHSVVYKGRKKKTIQYYGVKSIDKSQRPYVRQEVKILSSLKHQNVLGFYSWYETSNHLWLILEYCVGGDLLTLLRQDKKLPETSIHDFGRDILAAMHALHLVGAVHCDLKPSNVLLDENGRVKLGGFSLARKVEDVVKQYNSTAGGASNQDNKNKRGTPCYMAPELLKGEGGHFSCYSFASDFWALGCILYECAVGHPPFVSDSLNALVDSILHKEAPMHPHFSHDFKDLLERCLTKNPTERIDWEQIIGHPFWKSKISSPVDKNEVPNEEMFVEIFKKCGFFATSESDNKENGVAPNGASSDAAAATAAGGSAAKSKERENIFRLSRIAKKNLQSEGVDYGISNDDEGDVKLDNADTELDFSEESTLVPAGKMFSDESQSQSTSADSTGTGDKDSSGIDGEVLDMHFESSATSNSDSRKTVIERELSSSNMNDASSSSKDDFPAGEPLGKGPKETTTVLDAQDLAFHSSDLLVKPIVGNRRIEKQHDFQWDAFMLPFEPITLQEMLELDQDSLESLLSMVYKSVASSSSVSERLNVLAYFSGLCKDSNSANILINSSLMHMFVTKLRGSKVANLKTHFAAVIGTLIRHATFIGEDVPKTGIIDALTESVRDKNELVRRKSMSALGELLFYIITQQQEENQTDTKKKSMWYVPNGTTTTIVRLLRNVEDPVTQHYAVKTLENVFSVGGEWALRLGTHETALNLAHICSNAKSEHLKVTASSALARLYRCNVTQTQMITDKIGMRTIIGFFTEGNAKVQQSFGTVFIMALASASNKSKNALSDEKGLTSTLIHLLDHGSHILRGKAVISIVQLSKLQIQWFVQLCNSKLIILVERLNKIQDDYVSHCVALLQSSMPLLLELLIKQTSEGIEKLCARKNSAIGSRSYHNSSLLQLSQTTKLGCKALLAVMTSSLFRMCCASGQSISKIGQLILKLQKGPPALVSEIEDTIFNILEAMSQHGDILLSNPGGVLENLIPVLSISMINSQSGDRRFLCAKLLCDIVLFYISEIYSGGGEMAGSAEALNQKEIGMLLEEQIVENILPNLPTLLDDEDPIPLYSLKMLIAILDFDPKLAAEVAEFGLVPNFISYLSLDHPNNNVHNLRLCKIMTSAEDVSLDELLQHGIVEKAASVMCYTCENMVEAFIEPSLGLCHAIIDRAIREERKEALVAMRETCQDKIATLGKTTDVGLSEMAAQCVQMLNQ
jgi:serine/threonine-protein kinase ULK4